MKKRIGNVYYDTDKADLVEYKYVGEFGQPDGYEERLFVTKNTKQHFIYGVGGPGSRYTSETIKPVTDTQAEEWKKDLSYCRA